MVYIVRWQDTENGWEQIKNCKPFEGAKLGWGGQILKQNLSKEKTASPVHKHAPIQRR
jgi:hypothetical protein